MPGAFLLTAAPSGAPWQQVLQGSFPVMDPSGFVAGPWGECMHWAVVFEMTNNFSAMPAYADEGPAGQVINFAGECGFAGFQQALAKNEDATRNAYARGDQRMVFQSGGAAQGMMGGGGAPPAQMAMMGAGGAAGVMGMMGGNNYGGGGGCYGGQNQPLMGAPHQHMMGNLQHVNPYQMLDSLPMVHIIEKMNMLETAGGLLGDLLGTSLELEMANKYLITAPAGQPLFFAVENTDLLNRQCGGDCRGIDMDIVVLGQDPRLLEQATGAMDWSFNPMNGGVDLTNAHRFLRLHKDCQFTCCCYNRPIIDISDGQSGQLIGRIKNEWACCDMIFSLTDPTGNATLETKGGCCQAGLICPCPCGPCREVNFDVKDARKGREVGHLKKVIPDCLKFIAADDVDNYEVDFGQVKSPEMKAMLIALSLFIDFRYFNTRSEKNQEAFDFGSDFSD